jgi:2,3-bisphosphoglycerate-independent phosphoglycerate mutase
MVANFANADVIGHTGNFDAAERAVRAVDTHVGTILEACLRNNVTLVLTADHGNIEKMIDPYTGRPQTSHKADLVPFYVAGRGFEHRKSPEEADAIEREAVGILSDVAPTVLEVLNLRQPAEMTGQSLLKILK